MTYNVPDLSLALVREFLKKNQYEETLSVLS